MRISICDDNCRDADILKAFIETYLHNHGMKSPIDIFTSSKELIAKARDYQIIILDIVMGKQLGIEIAEKIHYSNPSALIVFYSSYIGYAPDTYESFGSGFLLKPLEKRNVYKCLDRLFRKINKTMIQIKEVGSNCTISLHINEIDYIMSEGKYTFVQIKGRKLKCRKSMKEWEAELKNNYFFLCKRGLLVNAHSVKKVDAFNYLTFNNGKKVKLSENIGEKFKEKLVQYWADNI